MTNKWCSLQEFKEEQLCCNVWKFPENLGFPEFKSDLHIQIKGMFTLGFLINSLTNAKKNWQTKVGA